MSEVWPVIPACLINGQPAESLSVHDRGLAYGDGLFETVRVSAGRATLGAHHMARLARGAQVLRMPVDIPALQQELDQLALQLGDGLIKLLVTRGAGERGYRIPEQPRITRIMLAAQLPDYPVNNETHGVRLYPCSTRLASQPALAGLKHLNRLEQILARSEWSDPGFAEGLVCDMAGNAVECTMSNLFVRLDGQWVTPDLSQCGVQGVMRDYLIDALAEQGVEVVQRTLALPELLDSAELFCCNSVFGIWPIVGLMDKQWSVGPDTLGMQALAKQALT